MSSTYNFKNIGFKEKNLLKNEIIKNKNIKNARSPALPEVPRTTFMRIAEGFWIFSGEQRARN